MANSPIWTPPRGIRDQPTLRALQSLFRYLWQFQKRTEATSLRRLLLPLVPRTTTSTAAGDVLLWQKAKADGPYIIGPTTLEITVAGPTGLTLDIGIADDGDTTDASLFSSQPADLPGLFTNLSPARLNVGQYLTANASLAPTNLTGWLYVAYMRAGSVDTG